MGKTEAARPAAGAQEHLGGGPLNGKGSKNALLGFPGRRPRSWRRPGSLQWSSRQLATWITDHLGLSVAESTVYRLLKKEGLIKAPMMQLLAGKEYQRKTSGPHQMWATDASYFRVSGWGYYYMVTVMDDYHLSLEAARGHDG